MKKIVNGLRYDTETARLVGEAGSRNQSVTDFSYWSAGLYKTARSGRYFLAGEGGAQTRFAQSCGQNSWSGGKDLIPMEKREAIEWACQNLTNEEIEKEFGDEIKDA